MKRACHHWSIITRVYRSGTPSSSDLPCSRRHASKSTTGVLFFAFSSTYGGHERVGGGAGGAAAGAVLTRNVRRLTLVNPAVPDRRPAQRTCPCKMRRRMRHPMVCAGDWFGDEGHLFWGELISTDRIAGLHLAKLHLTTKQRV